MDQLWTWVEDTRAGLLCLAVRYRRACCAAKFKEVRNMPQLGQGILKGMGITLSTSSTKGHARLPRV
jgi:hypothetical protein